MIFKYQDEKERYDSSLKIMRDWLTDDIAKDMLSEYRIGVVCSSAMVHYQHGDVVLFREFSKNGRTSIIIEKPMSPEQITIEKANRSLLRTLNVTINVPRPLISDITDLFR